MKAEVRMYSRLFNVPNPGAAEDFLATINDKSLEIIENAYCEESLSDVKIGDAFQFERTGYFCVDSKLTTDEHKVFNLTVALKEDSSKASS
jgi:glutaminyl-tRNA synthetase